MDANSIIQFLQQQKQKLQNEFGVVSIGLFGSFAENRQKPESDIDFLVETEKVDYLKLVGLLNFLEKNFGRKVDLTRKGSHLRPSFLNHISKTIQYA